MKREALLSIAAGLTALALGPLALPGPAAASSSGTAQPPSPSRPDPSFTPAARSAALAAARQERDATARTLRLGAREALVVRDVTRDADGVEHVRYDRTYAGLPVVGGDLVVRQSPSGAIRTVSPRSPVRVPSTTPRLPGAAARAEAAAGTRLRPGAEAPVKVVFAARHRPVLAWQTTLTGTARDGTPVRDLVYTDATSGAELARYPQVLNAGTLGTGHSLYSGTVSLGATRRGSTYRLRDNPRGGHRTYDARNASSSARGRLFTDADDEWGTGAASNRQSAAVDAAYGAGETWDFYQETFQRTGIRNDGVGAYSRVHYGQRYDNAFWDDACFCMTYGDGGAAFKPLVAVDVAGHEMSHGVTASTAGLVYYGDAGGLDESTSDVMGTMVEFYAGNASDPGDYYIGENIARDGTWLRRMDDPSLDGASPSCWSSSVRNLDPHYASGVGNHLFYLLAEGTGSKTIGGRAHRATACDGSTLTGIGRDAAARIWYRALTAYWTSTTSYPQAANGMVEAARDLYGAASARCTATRNAWKGVRVTPTQSC